MLEPPLPVLLDHDEAALSYACEMANKLRKSGRYNDPSLVVNVMDESRPMIFWYRFLLRTPDGGKRTAWRSVFSGLKGRALDTSPKSR